MIERIKKEILNFIPSHICDFSDTQNSTLNDVTEFRIRIGQPLNICTCKENIFVGDEIRQENILKLLEIFSDNSIYAVQSEINSGYITIRGGHRIGISGTCIVENGQVKNIKYISSLNIRVAREVKDCSKNIFKYISGNSNFENTLILSPPGCGKTTLLRDMIRCLSDSGTNIGLVDERSEIAAMYRGTPQNDIGKRTDVMNNCLKHIGMKMMIRSMSPEIIATDEVGGNEDEEAIAKAGYAGVKLLLTAHGKDLNDISEKLLNNKVFKNIIILGKSTKPGFIKNIYSLKEDKYVVNY